MRCIIYIAILLSFAVCGFAQVISKPELINQKDSSGKKQGKWIVTGLQKPGSCYKAGQIAEEGLYLNNRKDGAWTEYYCNGNIKNKLTYANGRPNGPVTTYHENGVKSEEGTWTANRWMGLYIQYNEQGDTIQKMIIKKTNGTLDHKLGVVYPKPGFREIFDSLPSDDRQGFDKDAKGLNGFHRLYNNKRQLTKEGYFKNNRLIDGKCYFYNESDFLERIAVFKNGQCVGDEVPEKKE